MSDPFDTRRDELVTAAKTLERASARRAVRPLAAIAAALVVVGSATAAVVSLTGELSAPLSGTLPGGGGPY